MYSVLLEHELKVLVETKEINASKSDVLRTTNVILDRLPSEGAIARIAKAATAKKTLKVASAALGAAALTALAVFMKKVLTTVGIKDLTVKTEKGEKTKTWVLVAQGTSLGLALACIIIAVALIAKKEQTEGNLEESIDFLFEEENKTETKDNTETKDEIKKDKKKVLDKIKELLETIWGKIKDIYTSAVEFVYNKKEKKPNWKNILYIIIGAAVLTALIILIRRFRMSKKTVAETEDITEYQQKVKIAGEELFAVLKKMYWYKTKLNILAALVVLILMVGIGALFTATVKVQ